MLRSTLYYLDLNPRNSVGILSSARVLDFDGCVALINFASRHVAFISKTDDDLTRKIFTTRQ